MSAHSAWLRNATRVFVRDSLMMEMKVMKMKEKKKLKVKVKMMTTTKKRTNKKKEKGGTEIGRDGEWKRGRERESRGGGA